jgi:hypothetical protein
VKDSSAVIEKRLGGSKSQPESFENLEEIPFSCRDSDLDSSVIRVISIQKNLGWISEIMIKLALFIIGSDYFTTNTKKYRQ